MQNGYAFSRLTGDQLVREGPVLFGGIIARASVAGAQVAVYDGMDPTSGRLVHTYTLPITNSTNLTLHIPIAFDRGLYVDLDANVTEVTVLWIPVPEDPPARAADLMSVVGQMTVYG